MPILERKLRLKLQKVADLVGASRAPVRSIPEIRALPLQFRKDIKELKKSLTKRLEAGLRVMDHSQAQDSELNAVRKAIVQALQGLEGAGPNPNPTDGGVDP